MRPIVNGSRYSRGDVSSSFMAIVRLKKIDVVLAPKIGAEMFTDLKSAGVRMYYIDRPGTVGQLFLDHQHGHLELAKAPNVGKGYGRDKIRWLAPW